MAVKNVIPSCILDSPPDIEVISVRLEIKKPVILCAVYIPPNSSVEYYSNLLEFMKSLCSISNVLVIVGDFNMPGINWSTLTGSTPFEKAFCDIVFDLNLTQLVINPTHISGNILDLVLINAEVSLCNVTVLPQYSVPIQTDHFIVLFTLSLSFCSTNKSSKAFIYDYSKADWSSLCSDLMNFDFTPCFTSTNVEYVWSFIKNTISNSVNKFVPRVRLKTNQRPKWINPTLKHQINKLRSLRRRLKSSTNKAALLRLYQEEQFVIKSYSAAKAAYEFQLIRNFAYSNNSKIYRYLRNLTHSSDIPPCISHYSLMATSDKDKSCLFNQYFHSVFTQSNFTLPVPIDIPTPSNCLYDINFNVSDVLSALSSLDAHKAMGIDNIGPMLLKTCAISLCAPLHHLFSLTLTQHYIPNEWRIHRITPVFKNGDKSQAKNYRPISLLCSVSKVLERIIYDKIIDFVSSKISTVQYGFLPNHSAVQQLLTMLECIFKAYDMSSQTDIIFLDFKKAFDSVPHDELLLKLRKIGISGILWFWFRAYLKSRKQCVCINGQFSDFLPVLSGIPQGSILGPLLFLIYINDLPTSVSNSSVLIFADDTKCYSGISSMQESTLLQQDLNAIENWSKSWKLHFNESKFVKLSINVSSNHLPTKYTIGSTVICEKPCHKDLGITISTDLSWTNHYNHISKAAYKTLNLLQRSISKEAPISTKKLLYLSLVRSRLLYCSPVWRPNLVKDFTQLERIQRRASKFILNYSTHDYKSRLIHLKLLPLTMTLELNDILFFIKSMKSSSDHFNIKSFFSFHCSSTRSSSHLKLKHSLSKLNKTRHFYFNRFPRLWNSLPIIDINLSMSTISSHLKVFFWFHFLSNFNTELPCSYHFICPCNKCFLIPTKCLFTTSLSEYIYSS